MNRDRLLAVLQASPLWCSQGLSEFCDGGLDVKWYFDTYRNLEPDVLLHPEDCQEHYRVRARNLKLSPNLAFDEFWYRHSYPDVADLINNGLFLNGWEHYLGCAGKPRRNPAWWFDELWYGTRNPEAAEAVKMGRLSSGFEHYLLYGIRQNISPSLYFDAAWYREKYQAADREAAATVFPLKDYLLAPQRSARCPVQFFDPEWYSRTYLVDKPHSSVLVGYQRPYEYYVSYGRFQQHSPSAYFNERAYRELNPQVNAKIAAKLYTTGFEHYVSEGAAAGARLATHLTTGGTDYAGPAFLRVYERSLRLNFEQIAKLRHLSMRLPG